MTDIVAMDFNSWDSDCSSLKNTVGMAYIIAMGFNPRKSGYSRFKNTIGMADVENRSLNYTK